MGIGTHRRASPPANTSAHTWIVPFTSVKDRRQPIRFLWQNWLGRLLSSTLLPSVPRTVIMSSLRLTLVPGRNREGGFRRVRL